jgi:hypothetical protein
MLLGQFDQLKSDFRFNLSLLEDRDAELEKYDSEHALLGAAVADMEQQLQELRKLHAEAVSGACMHARAPDCMGQKGKSGRRCRDVLASLISLKRHRACTQNCAWIVPDTMSLSSCTRPRPRICGGSLRI